MGTWSAILFVLRYNKINQEGGFMVHLHTRSCYSLLKSPLQVHEIVDAAKEFGFLHVAYTDFHSMYGTMEFWKYAQSKGLHPIIGLELETVYQEACFHFVLLAKNDDGLQELYALSTLLMQSQKLEMLEMASKSQNCIVLTAGSSDQLESYIEHQNEEQMIEFLSICKNLWQDFYVSIAMNDSQLRKEYNVLLKKCAKDVGLETVALSRIYYKNKEDVEKLRLLQAIAKQTTLYDKTLTVGNGRYFRSKEEMEKLYDAEDLACSEKIAKQCNVQMSFQKSTLPNFENNLHIDNDHYLFQLAKAGLNKRLNHKVRNNYMQRLEYELSIIIKMGFTNYFLIVWDFIRYARKEGIYVGPGRGSSVGSLVAYCLGITHIDPVQNNLLFERFLNPERISMPDIDIDIPDDQREKMIDYVIGKYHTENVSHIASFTTLKAKQALRDVGRVMEFSTRKIDQLTKALGNDKDLKLASAYQNNRNFARLVNESKETYELFRKASSIEGLPRHVSLHAAGIVISNQAIQKVCPLVQIDQEIKATQFTKDYLEELGLIKMDFLGIRNLSIIDSIVKEIEKKTAKKLELLKLPLNDARTYQLLSNADTLGVFQLESDGIRKLLKQIQPSCFADVAATLALYRPGPMKNIPLYLQSKNHPETIHYIDQRLQPILQESYGVMIYQEQIMQIAQVIGGFTLAQADNLRKAMGKKDAQIMASYRQAFIEGAIKNGCRRKLATELFETMERFAEYGFNKCHSYGYGLIVYQMAYLKANYPLYFYQCILNASLGSEKKTSQYVYECQRKGIAILAPDVNRSEMAYEIENNALRMPLTVLKEVSNRTHKEIEQERQLKPFEGFVDFVVRITARKVSESNIRTLIYGGALDGFEYNRATMIENLSRTLQYASIVQTFTSEEVLFNYDVASSPRIIRMHENRMEKAKREKEVFGFYLSEHPVQALRMKYPKTILLRDCLSFYGNCEVIGQIMRYHIHKTKTNETMCFLTIEDESGSIDVAIMPKLYQEEKKKIQNQSLLKIRGKKNRPDSILANQIEWFEIS